RSFILRQKASHGFAMKPFLCTICGKRRFATDYGRAEHQRALHGIRGERSIPCSYPFCTRKRKFRHKFDLKQHLENPGKWHERKGAENSIFHLVPMFLSLPSMRKEEKGIFERARSSLEVNKFVSDELQPDGEFHGLLNNAIDSLYRELQKGLEYTNYGIHNLIKGGSIAKGTALKNNADLDCLMVMNGIENASQLSSKLPDILYMLESRLGSSIGDSRSLTSIKKTRFSLQFNMSRYFNPGESVKVDLLPTFEASVGDIDERERFYRKMLEDKKNWPYYSAALVMIQKHFVKERPALVKNLIRLVKYWRKTYIPQVGSKHVPPSYLLELLTIHAWENANHPESFDLKIGLKAVLEVLKNHQSLRVSWGDYYRKNLIPSRYIHGAVSDVYKPVSIGQIFFYRIILFMVYFPFWHFSLLYGPYVIDPANPTNNLHDAVDCWDEVKKVAEETMRKPLLRDVWVTANWR
ncbi:unnamed protein product, partial [Porites evermanni]